MSRKPIFYKRYIVQLFSVDATIFSKKNFFAHENMKNMSRDIVERGTIYRGQCPNSPKTENLYHQKPLNLGLGIYWTPLCF